MARFNVTIGRPDGNGDANPGSVLELRADSAKQAKELALIHDEMIRNPTWEIIGEPEEIS